MNYPDDDPTEWDVTDGPRPPLTPQEREHNQRFAREAWQDYND